MSCLRRLDLAPLNSWVATCRVQNLRMGSSGLFVCFRFKHLFLVFSALMLVAFPYLLCFGRVATVGRWPFCVPSSGCRPGPDFDGEISWGHLFPFFQDLYYFWSYSSGLHPECFEFKEQDSTAVAVETHTWYICNAGVRPFDCLGLGVLRSDGQRSTSLVLSRERR